MWLPIMLTVLLAISVAFNFIHLDKIDELKKDVLYWCKKHNESSKEIMVLQNKVNNLERRKNYKKKTL